MWKQSSRSRFSVQQQEVLLQKLLSYTHICAPTVRLWPRGSVTSSPRALAPARFFGGCFFSKRISSPDTRYRVAAEKQTSGGLSQSQERRGGGQSPALLFFTGVVCQIIILRRFFGNSCKTPTSCGGDFAGDLFLIKTIFRCSHCKERFFFLLFFLTAFYLSSRFISPPPC